MAMKKMFLYLLLFLVLSSCKESPKGIVLEEVSLTGEILFNDEDLGVSVPSDLCLVDTLLVTSNVSDGDTLVDVWGIQSRKRLNSFVNKGRGPSEFRRIDSFVANEADKCIYFYDKDRRKLHKVDYSELLADKPEIDEVFHWDFGDNSPFDLSDSYRLGDVVVGMNLSDTARFLMCDADGKLTAFDKVPEKKHVNPNLTDDSNARLYSHYSAIAPDNKKIAVFDHVSDLMTFVELEGNEPIVQSWVNEYPDGVYPMPIGDGRMQAFLTPDTKRHYLSGVSATNDYVFALYLGEKVVINPNGNTGYLCTNVVRVFNWKGQECYRLSLDKKVFDLFVTPDNKTLLALTDKEGYAVIRYEMDLD